MKENISVRFQKNILFIPFVNSLIPFICIINFFGIPKKRAVIFKYIAILFLTVLPYFIIMAIIFKYLPSNGFAEYISGYVRCILEGYITIKYQEKIFKNTYVDRSDTEDNNMKSNISLNTLKKLMFIPVINIIVFIILLARLREISENNYPALFKSIGIALCVIVPMVLLRAVVCLCIPMSEIIEEITAVATFYLIFLILDFTEIKYQEKCQIKQ